MMHRKQPSEPSPGITPGQRRSDHILVAEGRVVSPIYEGPIQVWIRAEYRGLLDLRVAHDDLPDFAPMNDLLVDEPVFGREVVWVLQEAGKLPPGEDFMLDRAERGMQRPDLAIFESLHQAGHCVGRAAALAWGAVDLESVEEWERLHGTRSGGPRRFA